MRPPKYTSLLEKSVHAAIAAIEIYNKPDSKYREEAFSILLINAWELLFKARLVKLHNNYKCLYIYENKINKDGIELKTKILKRNHSGNPYSITMLRAMYLCASEPSILLNSNCEDNILLLVEIRNSAIHFLNNDKLLCKKIFELGTACLRNYLSIVRDWFDYDLSKYNFYLMPLSFFHEFESAESYSINTKSIQIQNLLKYISNTERFSKSKPSDEYSISLNLRTTLVKATGIDVLPVSFKTGEEESVNITFSEEDNMKKYPIKYKELTEKLSKRYIDFKVDVKFHQIKNGMTLNRKFCYLRYLYPDNPNGNKTCFYNTEVFKEFDKHYTKVK